MYTSHSFMKSSLDLVIYISAKTLPLAKPLSTMFIDLLTLGCDAAEIYTLDTVNSNWVQFVSLTEAKYVCVEMSWKIR